MNTTNEDTRLHILDALGTAPESRFTALHAHVEGGATPPLLESFVTHLDQVCGLADITDAKRLRTAMTRLEREYPDLHAAVVLMAQPKATTRGVGELIGVSRNTVSTRHRRGLAVLRDWCQSAEPVRDNVA